MDTQKLIAEANRIISGQASVAPQAAMAQALELFRNYAGPNSSFYKMLLNADSKIHPNLGAYRETVVNTLRGFVQYLEAGLFLGISPERKAQADVVSDFLEQANSLLEEPKVHPAAPAMIIGGALEEFLRNWVDSEKLDLKGRKPGIDTYAGALREADLITKQDAKDITAWAGLRNHAAHGEWDRAERREEIGLMLQGVNLFMRKYIKE